MELRLKKRYEQLLKGHMQTKSKLAAGPAVPPSIESSKAAIQGAWRFFNNEAISVMELSKPILEQLDTATNQCEKYILCANDWSRISYNKHEAKTHKRVLMHKKDLGYELQSSLLISDRDGQPLLPVVVNLSTANQVLSSYSEQIAVDHPHLQELAERSQWLQQQVAGDKKLVQIVDREGDSVGFLREVPAEQGFLVRCRKNSQVEYNGEAIKLERLAEKLEESKGEHVKYKKENCRLHYAEAPAYLTREAKQKRYQDEKQPASKIEVKVVIARLVNSRGECLSTWYLISNILEETGKKLSQWYAWRWKIESFFKLLKQAGFQLESWGQQTPEAIAKRMMIALMACTLIWQLQADQSAQSKEFKKQLLKMSGRQLKPNACTDSALLAGLWVYLNVSHVFLTMSHSDISDLIQLGRSVLKVV